jgi:hypothetical protein
MTPVAVSRVAAAAHVLPAFIAGAGDWAALRFLDFTVNIRNRNTRAAYAVRLARDRAGDADESAHSVRGPRHSVRKGVTPVLSSEEATALLTGMDVSTVVGLRDRAIIAVMTYTFARVGTVSKVTPYIHIGIIYLRVSHNIKDVELSRKRHFAGISSSDLHSRADSAFHR